MKGTHHYTYRHEQREPSTTNTGTRRHKRCVHRPHSRTQRRAGPRRLCQRRRRRCGGRIARPAGAAGGGGCLPQAGLLQLALRRDLLRLRLDLGLPAPAAPNPTNPHPRRPPPPAPSQSRRRGIAGVVESAWPAIPSRCAKFRRAVVAQVSQARKVPGSAHTADAKGAGLRRVRPDPGPTKADDGLTRAGRGG